MQPRILVVEDHIDTATSVKLWLTKTGMQVGLVHDGNSGLREARSGVWDLILLDIRLPPGPDGFLVCRQLIEDQVLLPVIMMTSQPSDDEECKAMGEEYLAIDYIRKPLVPSVLEARIRRALRAFEQDVLVQFRYCTINLRTGDNSNGRPLTGLELKILRHFHLHPGQWFNQDALLMKVWGDQGSGIEETNAVDAAIHRVRQKIGQRDGSPTYIESRRGYGYRYHRPANLHPA